MTRALLGHGSQGHFLWDGDSVKFKQSEFCWYGNVTVMAPNDAKSMFYFPYDVQSDVLNDDRTNKLVKNMKQNANIVPILSQQPWQTLEIQSSGLLQKRNN